MIHQYLSRRNFLNYLKVSLLFLLISCQNASKKIVLGLHKQFFPEVFLKSIPKKWILQNINFDSNKFLQDMENLDLLCVNDGWLNNINFKEFDNIEPFLLEKLNARAKSYLNLIEGSERKKLMPIGVIPYAIVIKNNKSLKIKEDEPWNFLLDNSLQGKIILPNSSRIIFSIANKMKSTNSLTKLLSQDIIFDDLNAIDRLINSEALIALMPYTEALKYLKIDSRLSIIFLNQGVPLIWQFFLFKNIYNQKSFLNWFLELEKKNFNAFKHSGWFLPLDQIYIESTNQISRLRKNPSQECWNNSWSLHPLTPSAKIQIENLWK
tara:strand:- start:3102 stop:4067 length:966 start_codon:yes stop_codon:yes gene_type:complete